MCTVPASFLSVACLQMAARKGEVSPDKAKIILNDFCVDDCLTGASTIPREISLRHLNHIIYCN